MQELDAHYVAQNLYERLQQLWNISSEEWSADHQTQYDKCDDQHIAGMLAAEAKTCKKKLFDWSPTFSRAVENKAFWKIVLSLRRNHLKPNQKITLWAESLGHNDIHRIPLNVAKNELRKAQKKLKEIKQRAFELREEHLRELLSINTEFGDDNEHKKRLQILIRAHTQKKSFQRIQQVLRPSERTGLSHIVVPEKFQPSDFPYDPGKVTNWEMIHDQER